MTGLGKVVTRRVLNLPRKNGQPWAPKTSVPYLNGTKDLESKVRPKMEAIELDWPQQDPERRDPSVSGSGIDGSGTASADVDAILPCLPDHLKLLEVGGLHPLMAASLHAFATHRALVLTPDVIWMTIAQGVAKHVNEHSEELRGLFVKHAEGKAEIVIRHDELVSRLQDPSAFATLSPDAKRAQWRAVLGDFSSKVAPHFANKDLYDLFTPNFTTTTPVAKAASDVVMLEAVRSYFELTCMTLCHIPQFVLEGTVEDWAQVVAKVERLQALFANFAPDNEDLSLKWWTPPLLQAVKNMARTVQLLDTQETLQSPTPAAAPAVQTLGSNTSEEETEALLRFWRSWFKEEDESGGPYIRGVICTMFPYLQNRDRSLYKNKKYVDWRPEAAADNAKPSDEALGITTARIPGSLSKAPFQWLYHGTSIPMQFAAGPLGVVEHQHHHHPPGGDDPTVPDGALQPVIGYIVAEPSRE